jgi:DNA-binding transcriptional ArsR family regulator
MELDFKTIKALSSPTRIKILRLVLQGDYSPTEISSEIGRSKSTVASHLEHLQDAELVEKDSEEGRRRVLYSSTRKAETIVQGKERKVKFSIASSAITGLSGIGLIATELIPRPAQSSGGGQIGTMTAESTRTASESAFSWLPDPIMYVGLFLIVVSLGLISYGLAMKRLGEE